MGYSLRNNERLGMYNVHVGVTLTVLFLQSAAPYIIAPSVRTFKLVYFMLSIHFQLVQLCLYMHTLYYYSCIKSTFLNKLNIK